MRADRYKHVRMQNDLQGKYKLPMSNGQTYGFYHKDDLQKEITKQKAACTSAFAKCRKYEDEALSVLATCSQSKDKLTLKVRS